MTLFLIKLSFTIFWIIVFIGIVSTVELLRQYLEYKFDKKISTPTGVLLIFIIFIILIITYLIPTLISKEEIRMLLGR
ncbi:hypothetical protein KKH38_00250 [Patescibacteria group bacterium]|nr:hypothetical protein [Patescibacteria group bacterium]MCG2698607.1 hypothetical protein [Candidatus Parcubacteria bacterium]